MLTVYRYIAVLLASDAVLAGLHDDSCRTQHGGFGPNFRPNFV